MAEFSWKSDEEIKIDKEKDERQQQVSKEKEQQRVALDEFLIKQAEDYMLNVDVPEEEKRQWTAVFDPFEPSVNYPEGKKVRYDGTVYEVIQTHTSQMDWLPPDVPALFKPFLQEETEEGEEVIHEWKQPTDGHDAYVEGDKVSYEDSIYKSLIDGNTWKPTDYPQGWEELEELNE